MSFTAPKGRADRPTATSWDKISSKDPGETLAHRDVYEGQQLDRSKLLPRRSKTPGFVVAAVLGLLVAALVWLSLSVFMAMMALLSSIGTAAPDPMAAMVAQIGTVGSLKAGLSAGSGLVVGLAMAGWLSKRIDTANLMSDTSDINQYANDQHIALPEEIQRKFDWFPDSGAHSSVQVSSMISHMMLTNKGLAPVEVTEHAGQDVFDENGDVVYYRGEVVDDEAGNPKVTTSPMIDEEFGDALFDASGLPKDRKLRKKYDPVKIPYNPGDANRDKLKGHETVADLINADWQLPDYEVQRPGGAYIVDTAPVNTMVLAITRAGKGQTYIEPMLDMWSRETRPSNMVINDPKGELLVNNYVPFSQRGFQVVQFNLINSMKTDIYNPLGMAADAAREGDSTKCALYVNNIADVFFPLDGAEDPVWPNAANNAFKRAAYGLIDFYLEEERELREEAAATGMDVEILESRIDDMWGKVTLYNCYQLFVQLTAKKIKNPKALLDQKVKAGEFDDREDELEAARQEAEQSAFLWEDKPEQDMLTLFFNATEALPTNTMRTLIGNANNALRAMAGAEKMLASVYGIAITAMSFFTDPTISTLTSGKPSQNTDLAGLSFPRRIGVRFSANYLKRDHLIGQQCLWRAYGDPLFTQDLGADFEHADIIGREGWARYNFKGIFPAREAWLKLELVNPQTGMLVRTFYFHFRKSYQTSLNGRHYVTEPVTGAKIIKNGTLREVKPVRDTDGRIVNFKPGDTLSRHRRLLPDGFDIDTTMAEVRAITQHMVKYSEQTKAVFLVTPPHLMSYAKLILILVKQLVDVSFDQSYMTKANQKPLYRTRFMLDELGNLQSEGHGIAGLETMLSIGLGQEQQFTLILQTLQQLRDVYGDSVDRVVQGNTSNIVFLKSTDDSMIETLEKMSGKRHRSYIDSKSISQDLEKIIGSKNEGRVQYTMSTKEEPVISYNDMAFIPERNSVVFRAGDAPVWNRNETILPMSWRLLRTDRIVHPGHEYTLQTIPTLSSALDFDVRTNQPDFVKMLEKRMAQAEHAADAKKKYKEAYGYEDVDIARLDPDVYSDEVMGLIGAQLAREAGHSADRPVFLDAEQFDPGLLFEEDAFVDNVEAQREVHDRAEKNADLQRRIYAEGLVSKDMLVNPDGSARQDALRKELTEAYRRARTDLERDTRHFRVGGDGQLCSADGATVYVSTVHSTALNTQLDLINARARDKASRVFAAEDLQVDDLADRARVTIHPEFYTFLASQPTWSHLAGGEFDKVMAIEMRASA